MRVAAVAAAFALMVAAPAGADPVPIPEGPDAAALERFAGEPWRPDPIVAPDPPRHPHMAPNARSNLHVDAFQTDVHQGPGPLGNGTSRLSTFHVAECASVTFDSRDRIVTACVGLEPVTLVLMDPKTLDTLATFSLPGRPPSANPFQNFTGGGYFYLDERDRAVVPTSSRHIFIVAVTAGGFEQVADLDVTGAVPDGDAIISALPDWSGRIWFASRNGVVGTVDEKTATVRSFDTEEPNGNSFAVDADGSVSIVSDKALYRFEAGPDGTPIPVWREPYENDNRIKPGQTQAGSGTTPTLIGADRVAITDNADPINVLVYQRTRTARGKRLVCRQPVFEQGAGSTDQSLVATPDFIIAENNFGYTGPVATQNGNTTTRGLVRIDLHPSGRGCSVRWNSQETAPSVVPKVSAANGLLYTYTKEKRPDGADAWYLTAIDVRTGRTVFKALGGEGLGYNNNYAPITLGPDGTAYVGVLGGLLAVRDASPPAGAALKGPGRSRVSQRCARGGRVRVSVSGGRALRVVVRRGRRVLRIDGKAPLRTRLRVRARTRLVVSVRHEGGSITTHRLRARRC